MVNGVSDESAVAEEEASLEDSCGMYASEKHFC